VTAAQRTAGLDPHVLTPYGFPWGRAAPPSEHVDGIPHWRLEPGAVSPYDEALAGTVTGLAARLAALRPAALHAASDFVNARVALALRDALGTPVVYEVRGLWEESWVADGGPRPPGSELRDLRREAELRCMREADAVVTLGEGMRAELVSAGIPPERVVVVPNAADPVPPFARPRDQAGEPVVGYVGAVVPYEGLDTLLRALARLQSPARGVVVGGGGDAEVSRLRELAGELGVAERVRFTGQLPYEEARRWYSRIDLFCVPRRDIPACRIVAPSKPFEAMAAGCATLASDLPALREVVRDGETGVLVAPEDPAALAAALDHLIARPERRRALGDAARAWVSEHRTWAGAGARYRELYAALGAA
jgi:glycosyltransferase involved in cell wall biosynthesis